MTKTIRIPKTPEEVKDTLEGLDALLTAKEWERAAIVFALTYEGNTREGKARKRQAEDCSSAIFTVTQFLDLKISGLISAHTVKIYRDAWQAAIDAGQASADIFAGQRVTLPEMGWPATRTGTDGYSTPEGAQKTIDRIVAKHGAAILAAQAAKPEVAAAVANDPQATKAVIKQRHARTKRIITKRKLLASDTPDANDEIDEVTEAVDAAAEAYPSNSPYFTAMERSEGECHTRWMQGVRKQAFTALDRSHMAAFLYRLRRLEEEVTAYVEAEDDPYEAVDLARAEREEQFNLEMDLAEAGIEIPDFDAIERYANEGVA